MLPDKILFVDLDDTLYPRDNGVWQAISRRIQAYLVERIGLKPQEAERLRKTYLDQFGTTLNGLRAYYDIDPYDYLEFVHLVNLDSLLQPDPRLRRVLQDVPQRKVIFTNASRQHADRVLSLLGVEDLFDSIIDITALEFVNKPDIDAYQRALQLSGHPEPRHCILVDDRAANLMPAAQLGFTTILVGSQDGSSEIDYQINSIYDVGAIIARISLESET